MNREDYQKIKHIFQSVLDIDSDKRSDYLNEKCSDDTAIRREVERLLDSYESGYLEQPAIEKVAELMVGNQLEIGQEIGHYKVTEKIGAGGMGEIYLARDNKLNRQVAVKILPQEFGEDTERMQRFLREAKFNSALNHPNIVTIYEIGEADGIHFIITEYIEGETLRDRLKRENLSVKTALELSIQIASALDAAHSAGIIHRDIKPENIMIRPDGLVKILDFGISKLIGKKSESLIESEAPTAIQSTSMGTIIGTAYYMSPEQARGQEIDTRTDIWSFGIVLYEMLSRRLPFEGKTTNDYIASILRSAPLPLDIETEEIPSELQTLIRKALRKDKDARYQTMKGLLGDLKELKNELAFAENMALADTLGRKRQIRQEKTLMEDAKTTAEMENTPTVFTGEYLSNKFETIKRSGFAGISLGVLILFGAFLVVGLFGWWGLNSPVVPSDSFHKMQITKLTYEGLAGTHASISPDGKYIVYVVKNETKQSLAVRQVTASAAVEIIPPADVMYKGLTFSPDGSKIYYTVYQQNIGLTLFEIPVLGGNPRKIIDDSNGVPAFSPDGKTIAFIRADTSLMLADANGGSPRRIAVSPPGEVWKQLVWHPDGNSITGSVFSSAETSDFLVEVSLTGESIKRIASQPWLTINGFAWLADGSGIIICGRDKETKLSQVWHLSHPDGETRRITNDLSNYIGVSLTADNKSLITTKQERLSNIWISTGADGEQARKITFDEGRDEGLSGIAPTSDGKIVYTVRTAGTIDLWVVNADGSGNRQLTFEQGSNFSPIVSPDGRSIVFISNRSGNSDIWRMDMDGGNPSALTNSVEIEGSPRLTPDGQWIVYQQTDADWNTTIWKLSSDGGNPIQLTETETDSPKISPDGRFFVCLYYEDRSDKSTQLALFPIEKGKPFELFDFPLILKSGSYRWDTDGKALIYKDNREGSSNLWKQSLDGGQPNQLTFFESGQIYQFELTRNGKGFVLARGNESSDVVMISNFR